jgi:hypothetical protein
MRSDAASPRRPLKQPAFAAVRAVQRCTTDRRRHRGWLSESCTWPFGVDYRAQLPDSVVLPSIYSREDGVVHWQSCVSATRPT